MLHALIKTRGRKITALSFVAALALAGAAIAYFTTNGSGTGTAPVGSSTSLTITHTGSISNLVPAAAAQPVTFTINNPSGKGNQNLGKVSATVASVTPTNGNTCTAANFTTTTASSAVGTINDGATYTSVVSTQPSVQMIDTGSNQDGCQGATVNLTLSAAQGS
jgi:hypothetical protein